MDLRPFDRFQNGRVFYPCDRLGISSEIRRRSEWTVEGSLFFIVDPFCQGARMVRELFEMARGKKACIIFFDEVDAIGGARFDDGAGGDNEVQRTMLELINQLDGFDPRGNIKVLMATNRPDTLDPALVRPGRLDRKVEFNLPDLEVDKTSISDRDESTEHSYL